MRRAKAAARRAAALLAALTLLAAPAIAAGAAEPAHVLSYTTGRLTWDSATGIDENGAAVLSLFADAYQNVLSENGERVVAPGTDGSCTVRLENRMGYAISYIAVAYRIKEAEILPVEPEFSCEGAEDTGSYPLPEGVEDAQVMEGHIYTPEDAIKCLYLGAHAVVVGSAITRPHLTAKRFTDLMSGYRSNWRDAERSKH